MSALLILSSLIAAVFIFFVIFILAFYHWRWPSHRKLCRKIPAPKMLSIFGVGLDLIVLEHSGALFWEFVVTVSHWFYHHYVFTSAFLFFIFNIIAELMNYIGNLWKQHGPIVYIEYVGMSNVFVAEPQDIEVRILFSAFFYFDTYFFLLFSTLILTLVAYFKHYTYTWSTH